MSIGARIRQARQHTNLSLDALAHRAGMSKNGLALIETGKSDPHYSTLKEIARALNIEVAELLEEPALAGKDEAPEEGQKTPRETTELTVSLELQWRVREAAAHAHRRLKAGEDPAEVCRDLIEALA